MRLYLSGNSKNNIGYTPDTLIICNNHKRYCYDINGTTDFSIDNFSCRTKGDLLIEVKDNFKVMNNKQKQKLVDLLKDKESEIIVSIYPATISIDDNEAEMEKLGSDEVTDCEGTLRLSINDEELEVDFKFYTEFYGI